MSKREELLKGHTVINLESGVYHAKQFNYSCKLYKDKELLIKFWLVRNPFSFSEAYAAILDMPEKWNDRSNGFAKMITLDSSGETSTSSIQKEEIPLFIHNYRKMDSQPLIQIVHFKYLHERFQRNLLLSLLRLVHRGPGDILYNADKYRPYFNFKITAKNNDFTFSAGNKESAILNFLSQHTDFTRNDIQEVEVTDFFDIDLDEAD